MDANHFDDVARSLTAVPSRRKVLGFSLGGLAAAINIWDAEAKKGKNQKKKCKKCGPCKACKKGKCKGIKPDGTECGGPCLECQGGECVAKTGEACGDGHVCLDNGSCADICEATSDCPVGCFCSQGALTVPPFVCLENIAGCADIPLMCSSVAPCPDGQACIGTTCNEGSKRCIPLCPN
jgi:hypothetical protein